MLRQPDDQSLELFIGIEVSFRSLVQYQIHLKVFLSRVPDVFHERVHQLLLVVGYGMPQVQYSIDHCSK